MIDLGQRYEPYDFALPYGFVVTVKALTTAGMAAAQADARHFERCADSGQAGSAGAGPGDAHCGAWDAGQPRRLRRSRAGLLEFGWLLLARNPKTASDVVDRRSLP
jgi:hypothetical protein